MPTEQELISRTPQPATRASLARQMRENGLTLGGTVLVHSSLSSLGWVAGGPVAVIQALLDCVGPQGTIVMPTHSGDLTDPADWRSPPVPADWVQISIEGCSAAEAECRTAPKGPQGFPRDTRLTPSSQCRDKLID